MRLLIEEGGRPHRPQLSRRHVAELEAFGLQNAFLRDSSFAKPERRRAAIVAALQT